MVMAKKKPGKKKDKKKAPELGASEMQELDIIVDRLRVQTPDGESLENFLHTLRLTLADRPALVVSLLEKLSKEATSVTYQAYLALRDLISKAHARVIRQAEYRFRQRGFGAKAEAKQGPRSDKVVLVPSETRPAMASILSAEGHAWFASALVPRPYGEYCAVTMILDFSWHCQNLQILDGSLKQFKDLLRHMAAQQGAGYHEVPAWHVAGLFFESLDRYPEQRSKPDAGRSATLLKPYLQTDRKPYPYDVLPEIAEPAAHIGGVNVPDTINAIGSVGLLLLLPDKQTLQPYWEKIRQADESVLVVSPELKRQQTETIIEKATNEIFSPDAIRFHRRFLEEQALFCHADKRQALARDLWIIAQHLRVIRNPSESLYLRRQVTGGFYFHWRNEFIQGEPNEQPGNEAQEADGLRRTESGLILP